MGKGGKECALLITPKVRKPRTRSTGIDPISQFLHVKVPKPTILAHFQISSSPVHVPRTVTRNGFTLVHA